jgi:hypothetical protein
MTRHGAGLLCTHGRRFGMARHCWTGSTSIGARWWRVVASVVVPLVALSGGVGGRVVAPVVAAWWLRWWPRCGYPPPLPARLDARCALARPCGPDRRPRRRGLVASIQAGRTAIRRTLRGRGRCGPCSIRSLVRPLVARLHSCRSPLALCSWPGHTALRCVTADVGSSWAVGRVVQGGSVMNKIESLEGKPSVCGAFVRRCWLTGEDAGKTAGSLSRRRLWSLRAAPVVTFLGASAGDRREARVSMHQRRGILWSAARSPTRRATSMQEGSQP